MRSTVVVVKPTDALVDHVNFEREVLVVDVVLGGGVHVELLETEVRSVEGGGAVDDDLDRRAQVLKLDSLLRDIYDRAVCSGANGSI